MKLRSILTLTVLVFLFLTACQAEENKQSQPIQQRSELNYVSQNEEPRNNMKLTGGEPTSEDIENIRIEIESIEEVKVAQVQVQQNKMYVGVSMHPEVDPLEAKQVQRTVEQLLNDIAPYKEREVSVNASHLWQMRNLDGIGK